MGALSAGRAFKKIQGIEKQDHLVADKLFKKIHIPILGFRNRIPAFIRIDVAGILVVGAVANAPSVEGNQDWRVGEMAD